MYLCGERVLERAGQRGGRAYGMKAEVAERGLACFYYCLPRGGQEQVYRVRVSSSRTHPQSKKKFLFRMIRKKRKYN